MQMSSKSKQNSYHPTVPGAYIAEFTSDLILQTTTPPVVENA